MELGPASFRGVAWVEANRAKDNNPRLSEYYFGNLTEHRVALTTGRDITLAPKQSGSPVNFILYPCVEVGGQPYPLEKISRRFSCAGSQVVVDLYPRRGCPPRLRRPIRRTLRHPMVIDNGSRPTAR
jgi:hypothetical protein